MEELIEWNSTSHWDNHATDIAKHNLPFNQNQKYQSGLVVSDTYVMLDHHPMSMLGKMLKIPEATQNFIYHIYILSSYHMYSYVTVFLDGSKPIWLTISYLRGIPTKEQRGWSSTSRVRCVLRCHAWRCWRLGSAIGSQVNPYRTHRIPVGIPGLLKNVDRKLLKMVIEIVDWPIQNGGSFHSYVSLPVGIFHQLGVWGSHLLSAAPYLGPKDGRSQHGREKRIKTKGWWQSFMDFNGVCKKKHWRSLKF